MNNQPLEVFMEVEAKPPLNALSFSSLIILKNVRLVL
jgi:hypothetical protein